MQDLTRWFKMCCFLKRNYQHRWQRRQRVYGEILMTFRRLKQFAEIQQFDRILSDEEYELPLTMINICKKWLPNVGLPLSIFCSFLILENSFLAAYVLFLPNYRYNLVITFHSLPPILLVAYETSKPYIGRLGPQRAFYVSCCLSLLFGTVQTQQSIILNKVLIWIPMISIFFIVAS